MKTLSPNAIALTIIMSAAALTVFLFAESRNDPSLRIAALVSGTATVSALLAIGSTMLIGKDVTRPRDPADLPPNTTTSDTSTIKVGPDAPPAPSKEPL